MLGGGAPPESVSWLPSAQEPVSGSSTDVFGSFGTLVSCLPVNSAEVRSPTVLRRHADTFGTSTPNRLETSCSCEVWSNTSVAMWPPRLNGEITMHGTRTPSPSGPLKLRMSGLGSPIGNEVFVRYSPSVPAG